MPAALSLTLDRFTDRDGGGRLLRVYEGGAGHRFLRRAKQTCTSVTPVSAMSRFSYSSRWDVYSGSTKMGYAKASCTSGRWDICSGLLASRIHQSLVQQRPL